MMQLIQNNEVLFPQTTSGRPRRKRFLGEAKSEFTGFSTILNTAFNTHATREVRDLFDGMDYFDFPKPVDLILQAIEQGASEPDAIVLDFFSGSGTTAQAVMQLNARDNLRRQFICIQLPEPLLKGGEAYTAGFRTIADIGKERIRRAGDKIMTEWRERNADQAGRLPFGDESTQSNLTDIGFRVFKLDNSNLQKWDGSYVPPENADLFLQRVERSLDNLKPDRRDMDMVYEVFLKYGVPLTEKLAKLEIQGKTFYAVGDTGYLMICLAKGITVEIVEELIKTHTPGAVVFADACFADNNELTNAGLGLDKAQIEFRWI